MYVIIYIINFWIVQQINSYRQTDRQVCTSSRHATCHADRESSVTLTFSLSCRHSPPHLRATAPTVTRRLVTSFRDVAAPSTNLARGYFRIHSAGLPAFSPWPGRRACQHAFGNVQLVHARIGDTVMFIIINLYHENLYTLSNTQ